MSYGTHLEQGRNATRMERIHYFIGYSFGIRKNCHKNGKNPLFHRVLIWNKEELPQEWKESIIVPINKKGDRMDCNNYRGISLLSTSYKILSNILLSRMTPYANEML